MAKLYEHFGIGVCVVFLFVVCGCRDGREEKAPTIAPSVRMLEVVDADSTNACLRAVITTGSVENCSCRFFIFPSDGGQSYSIPASVHADSCKATVLGLLAHTRYCAFADVSNNAGQFVCSDTVTFITKGVDPSDNPDIPDNPPGDVEWVKMPDSFFSRWILARYDKNGDGKLSLDEAEAVTHIEMNTDNVFSVTGIEYFKNLSYLHIEGSMHSDYGDGNISELDLSHNTRLTHLACTGNRIKRLDLGSNPLLAHVGAGFNPIEETDFSNLKNASFIGCSWCNVKILDFSGLHNLKEIQADRNPYMKALILNNKQLEYLNCSYSGLDTLNISKCPVLNKLDCSNCGALTVYMSRNQVLGIFTKDPDTKIEYVD